ncbi:MAG TPA: carboxypeptidase-like regulatory domain-containing protein, partial [Bacteroidota bacterium]|nr:carboxypeptidase-like regulatory domain-containing protein [Bacteroidota bacterium]
MKNGLFGFRKDLIGNLMGVVLLISVFAPLSLFGQAGYGDILGRVSDNSGAVVPGATVTVRNEATNVTNEMQSNGAGDYVFSDLIPGT